MLRVVFFPIISIVHADVDVDNVIVLLLPLRNSRLFHNSREYLLYQT